MSGNPFKSYRDSYAINMRLNHPKIIVGHRSYYAGYYHGLHFEDCVRYLDNADKNKDCDKLIIGKYCSIASGAVFMMGGNNGHRHDRLASYPLDIIEKTRKPGKKNLEGYRKKGDTVIGNDVWIGTEAMIMPGIQIGDGAVIGARAVVTKNVEPYNIVGGNPAKVIKKRFTDEEIKILLKIKWWDLEEETILKNIDILRSGDVTALKKAIIA
ncbi:MAG: CatB-related O-acetyltransferase [Rickettsiales bacterium]|nr:CatB-related O-acetyltransferase [Pseudomonadota bacterium]MDA0966438.1 CatB-related O-acetyltransferase [Pseudomonadota bacterium]MDG4543300.1 CatB-related O-acetyltransferase [Rickettsiales bacterium]MDG4545566.1 CatB-related O-acetyltransferase [Rickettsiales bacterium]MDG4548015.1 CatB-related O-acetyltransferase [Rickettsiales bacterium]